MSYKNSSNFGIGAPTIGSHTPARKVKSNADIFEEHGNPWYGEDAPSRPQSPNGKLRMSRRAHLFTLMNKEVVPHGDHTQDISFSTEHSRPLALRIAKERNTLLKPMSVEGQSASLTPRSALLNARARINAKRASHLIKVK